MVSAYIGLGSNLGDRLENINNSIQFLNVHPRIKIIKTSNIYQTSALGGPKHQPKYLNAAVEIATNLSPFDLLEVLKTTEIKFHRKKTLRWGPRTLDMDILFYGDLVLHSKVLNIPHILLAKRVFVLRPLVDIAANFTHPLYKKTIKQLWIEIKDNFEEIKTFKKR